MTATLMPSFAKPVIFGESRLQTDSEVLLVTFTKEGWLYTLEESGILRKWSPETGQSMGWHNLSEFETLWAFSNDARVLASASDDLAIWDASSGRLLTTIDQPTWVTALAFHPDPNFLAVGYDDGAIGYWDAPGHHSLFAKNLNFHKRTISALAISPDGKRLVAASEDKTISIWDTATGKYIGCLSGHTDRIPALAWHPSGAFLVSAGWDTTARVWDAATLEPIILLNSHAAQVTALAFSRDGKYLACADSADTVHVWDFAARKTLHKLKVAAAEIRTLAFSADGKYLAANGDRIVHLWNPQTGQPYANVGPRSNAKTTVSLSPDGSWLITNAGGVRSAAWSTGSAQIAFTLESDLPVHTLAFSPNGKWIAGALGNRIRLWDADGKQVADWVGPEESITALAFSPDSQTLASGSDKGTVVWLWRVADGEPILLIPDALDGCTIEALAFHPDGMHLAVGGIDWMATGGSNGAVSLWNVPNRCEVTTFAEGATALAFHPAGQILASTTLDHSICLWDVDLKQLAQELVGHDDTVTCLAFDAKGDRLISGGADNTLRSWDSRGSEISCEEVNSQPTAVAFSPDGKYLYAGHANTTCSRRPLS
ncbi:MAG: hypothetical protein EXS16_16295 [Gemmataceae bacterium]|nr:hypothetical protein [Gemmataceae bacterium]